MYSENDHPDHLKGQQVVSMIQKAMNPGAGGISVIEIREAVVRLIQEERATRHAEYRQMQRAVARFLATPAGLRDDAELRDLVDDYEPSESEQGLVPIPSVYAER